MKHKRERIIIGWREWVSLPELGLDWIKVKVDTGARTSALHAFRVDEFYEHGLKKVEFDIHPLQRSNATVKTCSAEVIDIRTVSDSGGHRELRYVIKTPVVLGDVVWPIEITLTNRDDMNFRMLLGRTAICKRFFVNPGMSYLQTKPPAKLTVK